MGAGHGNDLSFIGGIREHLLISGHGGVEDHFTDRLPMKAEGTAFEYRAVRQCQHRLTHAGLPSCCSDRLVLIVSNQIPNNTLTTYRDRMGLWSRKKASNAAFLACSSLSPNASACKAAACGCSTRIISPAMPPIALTNIHSLRLTPVKDS